MGQARLPDINTAFTKYRNEITTSLKSDDYDNLIGAVYAWNGILPDMLDDDKNPKYRIIISDLEHSKRTKTSVTIFCYECDDNNEAPFEYEKIKVFDVLLPFIDQCVTREKTMKGWVCPKCNKVNLLDKTRELDKIVELTNKEPHFARVLPRPPVRRAGLIDRINYDKKMHVWGNTARAELDAVSAQFRDDNWSRKDEFIQFGDSELDGGEADFETD